MMHDRRAGYLADTTYPNRFYRELSPSWLNYVAVMAGAEPHQLDQPFTYLDLGCGFGHSTIINAAAFPRAQFHACDFHPAHIESATREAARLGVQNIHFHQAYFEEMLTPELPRFDMIVVHGVYSWVSPEVRRTVRDIVTQKLKSGGLLYLSYNCLPGWASEAPLRKLMLEVARSTSGPSEERAKVAVAIVGQFNTPSFKYIRDTPAASAAIDSVGKDPSNYLAHEFLNETWELHYSVDVADEMALSGATYLGSATLTDNHPMLLIDKVAAETIATLPTPRLQQLAMDLAVNQRFRRDVYLRGGRPAASEVLRNVDNLVIGCTTELDQLQTQVIVPRGKLTFRAAFIREVRELMSRGSMPLGGAVVRLGGEGRDSMEIRQNLAYLIAAGALAPFARAADYDPGAVLQRVVDPVVGALFNQISLSKTPAVVPCALLGNGTTVSPSEATAATSWLAASEVANAPPPRLARLGLLGRPLQA